jgi:hypothetical protein
MNMEDRTPAKCPFGRIAELNAAGEAYWLERLNLSHGLLIDMADVVTVGPEWMQVETERDGNTRRIWVRRNAIVSFELVEG